MMNPCAPPKKILRAPRPRCLLSACRHDPIRFRLTRPSMPSRFRVALLVASLALCSVAPVASAQQIDSAFFAGLHWRMIGPYRGGRTVAAAGVRGQPNVFYVAATDGGVWKSTDF